MNTQNNTTDYAPIRYVKTIVNGIRVTLQVTVDDGKLFGGWRVNKDGEKLEKVKTDKDGAQHVQTFLVLGFKDDFKHTSEWRQSKRYGTLVPFTADESHLHA